jgi:hypothetical protein
MKPNNMVLGQRRMLGFAGSAKPTELNFVIQRGTEDDPRKL